jgi:medium-chain acyl-[acyl-carrier-protein] hydrolase
VLTADPWFPFRRSSPDSKVRLFCLPPAGGGASLYREWPKLFPASIEVCAIQLPGRERRCAEAPIARLPPIVAAVASAMLPLLDLPFAIFGHSMGGLIAFEVARQLGKGSQSPLHTFISATSAPHHPDTDPIHQLSDEAILAKLRRPGSGYAEEILGSAELMELFLPVLRADAALTETYCGSKAVVMEPLACAVTVFIGTHDLVVLPERARDWRAYTHGPFREVVVPGGHDFLTTESPRITQTIASTLRV